MSQDPATRTAAPPSPASHGIDLKTLLITAVSSAAAAYTCSKLWTPGTLAAAAFTPVLVAIIREGLAKSTDVVTKVVPVRGVVRSATPEGPRQRPAAGVSNGAWSAGDPADADQPPIGEPLLAEDPATRVAQAGEIAYHGSGNRRRNWRVAIVTGLLGFLVAAVVFTVPELIAGESASGGGRSTTLFGGEARDSATPAVTTTTETTPAEETVTTPERETVTVPPATVTTPPPAVTTPEGQETTTTPVPPTTVAPPPAAEPSPPTEVPPG